MKVDIKSTIAVMNQIAATTLQQKSLYAFMYPEQVIGQMCRKGSIRVKIGETINSAEERIKQQTIGSGVSEAPVKVWNQNLEGTGVNSDHQVHKFIEETGMARRVSRDDKKSTEWFDFIAPDYLMKLAKDSEDDTKVSKEIVKYIEMIIKKIFENVAKVLQPVIETPMVEAPTNILYSWYARQLSTMANWYRTEVEIQDMKYAGFEPSTQPYVMKFELAVKLLEKAAVCHNIQPKILIVEAIEIVEVLVKLGYNPSQIHFMSTSSRKRSDTEELGVWTMNSFNALEKFNNGTPNMKYDICIQNPPYDKGLFAEFINMGVAVADRTISVHPSNPIIDMKPLTRRADRYVKLLDNLDTFKSSVELFNGNEHFSAIMWTPLSITEIDSRVKEDGVTVSGFYDAKLPTNKINQHGTWILKYYDAFGAFESITNHKVTKSEAGNWEFFVNVGAFAGRVEKSERFGTDFFTMIAISPRDQLGVVSTSPSFGVQHTPIGFHTEKEAENFIAYLKTKFARFALALYKTRGNIGVGEMDLIPWMDFTQEWTDEKLFAHFNLSEEDIANIHNLIPAHY